MAYYTALLAVTATGAFSTFTHALSITPSLLIARAMPHSNAQSTISPPVIGTIGTNVITVAAGGVVTITFDLEVQQIHSIIS